MRASRPAVQQSNTYHRHLLLAMSFSVLVGVASGGPGQTLPPDSIALQVAEETATLHIVPKSIETTTEKALSVAMATTRLHRRSLRTSRSTADCRRLALRPSIASLMRCQTAMIPSISSASTSGWTMSLAPL
jgi:hypothetical protein